VVVDGRGLSWEEFGDALEPFEGWTFHLSIREIDTARETAHAPLCGEVVRRVREPRYAGLREHLSPAQAGSTSS
jgi:hypothetical protein